ncbi:MAG: L,D-transpeptidase [Solirubrobacteraceae bacterium]
MKLALRTLAVAVAGLAAAAPAPAAAQVPTPTPPASVPAPTATPAPPAAVPGKLVARVKGGLKLGGEQVALTGDEVRVKGRLKPAVGGGQRVQLRLNSGGRNLKTRKVTVKPNGRFAVPMRLKAVTGKVTISAIHKASGKIKRAQARRVKLRAYAPSLSFGSDGPVAGLFNRELRKLKYAAPRSGTYDSATGRAVMAYRKVNGLPRTESPSDAIVRDVLAGRGAYKVRHPSLGKHLETDLSQQTLALVDGDKLVRVYTTSSGAPATPTVRGTYRFYRKDLGTNSLGMVHASYFIGGYAIHGYKSVPPYGASHGCLRVPIPDALKIFDWIELEDRIRVEA